ncbi:MAG: hypothetical protein ACT4OM_01410 [Actinomycetota bacterium]
MKRIGSALVLLGAAALGAALAWAQYQPMLSGAAVMAIVIGAAFRDRAEQVRVNAPEQQRSEPALTGIDAGLARLRDRDQPKVGRRTLRGRVLVVMGLVCGIWVLAFSVHAAFNPRRSCGESAVRTFLDGAGTGAVARACEWLATDIVFSVALISPFALGTAVLAVIDYLSRTRSVWRKLPWFGLASYQAVGPAPWTSNALTMGIALAIGSAILAVIQARLRPAGRSAVRLDLPYRKILSAGLAMLIVAAGALAVLRFRSEAMCVRSGERTWDPKIAPSQQVIHLFPKDDLDAVSKTAVDFYRSNFPGAGAQGNEVQLVEIEKIVLHEDLGIGLFLLEDGTRTVRVVGAILKDQGRWQLEAVSRRGPFLPLPYPSRSMALLGSGGLPVNFAGDTITLVESVDGCGAVMDRDIPVGGGVLVLYSGSGHVRSFEGTRLRSAVSTAGVPAGRFGPLDTGAELVADGFVRALLELGWQEASGFTSGPEGRDLARSFGVLLTGRYERAGPAREVSFGSIPYRVYRVEGPHGPASLTVQLADTGDGWKVVSLQLDSDVRPVEPPRPDQLA